MRALPTEHGFTLAFLFAAAVCALAAVASIAVSRHGPDHRTSRNGGRLNGAGRQRLIDAR